MPKTMPKFDAWNPGLLSEIPADLLPRVTLYNVENSDTDYPTALEAAGYCGLKPQDMTVFKVSRLSLHEVLIRVTADFHVLDGPNYEELGLNLRSMVDKILTNHVHPKIQELEVAFSSLRSDITTALQTQLENDVYCKKNALEENKKPSLFSRLLSQKTTVQVEQKLPELLALAQWEDNLNKTDNPFDLACYKGLIAVVGGIVGQHGSLLADKDIIVRLASVLVCNSYGSRFLGDLIDPIINEAAELEGYQLLPYQTEPFVMNVKGASAAGKSTIRPLQRELASRLGVRWEDFALVSPDYWRKYMLDYDSLGNQFKYAAMLTGQELEIIDKKLDGYMAQKAKRGQMPHLLIDRFRFDSFESSGTEKTDERLLSRFGHTVFMFFIITPPTETVERAWKRGQITGRYKAVDDLLLHNVEAYSGMPQLFLKWVNKYKQKVHFEFLDNDVPHGNRPKTVAFGWNGKITILDPDCIRRLSSYRKINVDAMRPEDVYQEASDKDEDLLQTFVKRKLNITFLDSLSLKINAQIRDGKCIFETEGFLRDNDLETVICAPDTDISQSTRENNELLMSKFDSEFEKGFTIGMWGNV